jgi:gamma-glutamyltranspeptidase
LEQIERERPEPLNPESGDALLVMARACQAAMKARTQWGDPRVQEPGPRSEGPLHAPHGETDTVGIVAIDGRGQGVALVQSIYFLFGSGVLAGGFFLHNRGAYFEDTGPNAWAPRKRPLHTLMPGMVMRSGQLRGLLATMGADGQFQTQVQLLVRILDEGLTAQEAVAAHRWLLGRFLKGDPDGRLGIEDGFPIDTATISSIARALGVPVEYLPRWDDRFGHAQLIWRARGLDAGSDPRTEGSAIRVRSTAGPPRETPSTP